MKTLSHLIQEAEERFEKEIEKQSKINSIKYGTEIRLKTEFYTDFLKTELTNIVKESFKNTRVTHLKELVNYRS